MSFSFVLAIYFPWGGCGCEQVMFSRENVVFRGAGEMTLARKLRPHCSLSERLYPGLEADVVAPIPGAGAAALG